jgi:hypothetical protein
MKSEELLERDKLTQDPNVFHRLRRAVQFNRHCADGEEIFIDRNRIYDDAFTQIGVLGISAELIGCVNRLKPLVLRRSERLPPWQQPDQLELLRNVLHDTHNFANMILMLLEEGNWAGKD